MKDIKIPGVLWVVLIVLGVTAAETYVEDPIIIEIVAIAALAILKYLSIGSSDIDEVIDIAEDLKNRLIRSDGDRARSFVPSASEQPREPLPKGAFNLEEKRPNKPIRFLLG